MDQSQCHCNSPGCTRYQVASSITTGYLSFNPIPNSEITDLKEALKTSEGALAIACDIIEARCIELEKVRAELAALKAAK